HGVVSVRVVYKRGIRRSTRSAREPRPLGKRQADNPSVLDVGITELSKEIRNGEIPFLTATISKGGGAIAA
ncbi:MAG: hypothetical protein P8101_10190, partial [Candidatus Thiodiazotropha sp.]